jgi:inorganic phosphate transporter, PiT family
MDVSLAVALILVLAAEFANGVTDAPNAIATVVSTRVLSPIQAVFMAAVLNIVGAIVTGTAVAHTIGSGIVKTDEIGLSVVAAAMVTILIWTVLAWYLGLPTSKTHEMVAGLAGAGLATAGYSALLWKGWRKIIIGLGFSTILGFIFAFLIMTAIYRLFVRAKPAFIKKTFSRLQILSSGFVAFSHGSNDGQKFMGVFALTLFLGGELNKFTVPFWVILLCGAVMGLGTIFGGWRIINTTGFRITRLEPVNGFAAESAASGAILLASHGGIPLSTTHTVNTAIMGSGAARRFNAVRWSTTRRIVMTWILTFPGCFVLGLFFGWLLKPIF